MAISSDPLQVRTKIPQCKWMNPEEKAVFMINKVIVPTSIIIHIQDNLCELIHGDTIRINRLLDECRGVKHNFFAVELVTDIALCEYPLARGPSLACMHMKIKLTNLS